MPTARKKSGSRPSEAQQQTQLTRSEDFITIYANNVAFEQSVWDLKLTFGLLDQPGGVAHVEQIMSTTIPWLQAKLLSIFLDMNLAAYEAENGEIKIPERMRPVLPPNHEANKKNPTTRAIAEAVEAVYRRRMEEVG